MVLMGRSQNNPDELWQWTADEIDVVEDSNAAYSRHLVIDKRDENGRLIHNEEEISALYEMIAICKEIGATPILVTTPFLSEYTDRVQEGAPEFGDEFYGIIDQVIKDTGVEYHDYSLFVDSDHLNEEGALVFTNILINKILK